MIKKIYVACSLTDAPAEFIEFINELKRALKPRYEVLEFKGLTEGTCEDVARHDGQCVKSSDLLLVVCTYPSTGLGIEAGIACERRQLTLAVAETNAKVTRLIQGLHVLNENFRFARYDTVLDVIQLVEETFAKIAA